MEEIETKKGKDKIIAKFEKDFKSMQNKWSKLHRKHESDIKFIWFGDQWDSTALEERTKGKASNGSPLPPRPTNVFNIVKPFIIKVVNGVKKMKPTLRVMPCDGASDKVLADVRRGVIRSIERNTGAVPSRLNALNDAVSAGYGFYRFVTEYSDPMSMDQDIKYKDVEDATTVLWDDGDTSIDGSDCKKVVVQERITKEEFKAETGKDWEDVYHNVQGDGVKISDAWGSESGPTISEYFYIEEKPEKLVQLAPEFAQQVGKKTIYYSDLVKLSEQNGIKPEFMIATYEDGGYVQRETTTRQVWWCKLAGKELLKKERWPGYWIPVFKVDGRKKAIGGEIRMDGLGNDAKGSQKSYNYARNNQLERMGMVTKAAHYTPVHGIPENKKYKWESSNTRNWATLEYNAYDDQGRPIPAPQRPPTVQVDPGLANEANLASEEIKATMGIYGAFVGDTTGNRSGRAVLAEAEESADTVFDFANNLANVMTHEGRVVNELIPKIFNTPRQVRMVGEDDAEKVIWINQKAQNEKGEEYYYDMNQGKFDVTVEMGPSDATKRVETREGMEVFIKALPEFASSFGDLYAKEQDWRNADQIAERVKKMIKLQYPGLVDDDEEDEKEPPPELIEAQQAIDEMNQQLQVVTQENEQLKTDKRIEAMKVQIEEFKAKTERMKAISAAQSDAAKLEVELEKAEMSTEVDLLKIKSQDEKVDIDAAIKERGLQVQEMQKNLSDETRKNSGQTEASDSGN